MYLFSIVAREDFISIVMDAYQVGMEDRTVQEGSYFREITPDQSFYIFEGPADFGEQGWEIAAHLSREGAGLKDIALTIQKKWQESGQTAEMEAVIGGMSGSGEIQYHIISNDENITSYYPKAGESLYYANDLSFKLKPMEELARTMMMRGMSTVSQAQSAQFDLFDKFAGSKPGVSSFAQCLVIEKASSAE
jgi:hypothetical protein